VRGPRCGDPEIRCGDCHSGRAGAGRIMTADSKSNGGNFQIAKEGWLMTLASYPNLSGSDYATAIVIAKHYNGKTLDAWPSPETIAKLVNREPTVWRSGPKLVLRLLRLPARAPIRRRVQPRYRSQGRVARTGDRPRRCT
jgi:hypothetical protein